MEGREERRRQRKRVKRGRRLGRMPRLPATPGAVPAPPFLQGGSRTPLVPTPLGSATAGYRPWLGVLRRGWWGHPPGDPLSPLRAFFWSLRVSEDFFLISCRARLYSGGAEVLSEGPPAQQRSHPARIHPVPLVPFAWSLSS